MKTFFCCSAFYLLIFVEDCLSEATGTPKIPEVRRFCHNCPKHEKAIDCSELLDNGVTKSGIYRIYPRSRLGGGKYMDVYCDMKTEEGGWTVIQRRGQYNNSENYFVKTWNEYKEGFGELKQEFWLGNDKIFIITNQGQYEARFDLTNENERSAFTEYENFWIDDERVKYKLHVSEARGPAGDSLSTRDGFEFHTVDQPVDGNSTMLAGWWVDGVLTSAGLNGLNLYKSDRVNSLDGITWRTFGGLANSLKASEIKVRPKKFRKEAGF